MSLGGNELIALDTSTIVHWARQDANGKRLLAEYRLDQRQERPILSTIVEGEIRGLAKCWNWGAAKLDRLETILGELVRLDAGHPDIVLQYASLYFEDQQGGHNTGDNDLWIAATARATGSVLLTFDGDFAWMAPRLVRVEIVAQSS